MSFERGGVPTNLCACPLPVNPYECFLEHFSADENPNFLRYTLLVLEKHAYAQQADLFRTIRERMEEKYQLKSIDVWKPRS